MHLTRIAISICTVIILIFLHSMSEAAVFHVNTASDGDCSKPELDCDLQSALDAARANNEDDTIEIGAGTFTPTSTYLPV